VVRRDRRPHLRRRDLVLRDAKVGKRHAVISPTPDGFVINDLRGRRGSNVSTGTQVAGLAFGREFSRVG
jgi:FHA domain